MRSRTLFGVATLASLSCHHSPRTWPDGPPSRLEVWAHVYQSLAAAQVVDWRQRYEPNKPISDGTQWSMLLIVPDGRVESSGSNAFPPRAQFDAAFAAVRALVRREHSFH